MPQNCVVFLLPRRTRSAIYGSQFYGTPINVFSQSKRKTTQLRGKLVWIIVFCFWNIFLTTHFVTNGYKRIFIDQLVRSKATCSFKLINIILFGFTHIHRCVFSYLPEFCDIKNHLHKILGWDLKPRPLQFRAVSYQLYHRECLAAGGSSNPRFSECGLLF